VTGKAVGIGEVLRSPLANLKCTETVAHDAPGHCTVQSPEVEPIREAEVRGSSRQQPVLSHRGRDGAMGNATLSRWHCVMPGARTRAPLRWDRGARGKGP